jgi:type VI protein secretion system component VasF
MTRRDFAQRVPLWFALLVVVVLSPLAAIGLAHVLARVTP